jgi:hypothetical protein
MNAMGPNVGSADGPPPIVSAVDGRERHPPGRRELHQKIMRVLTIDNRHTVERLTALEDFAVARAAHERRIETEHAAERDGVAAAFARRHAHPPVRRDEFLPAARPALTVEDAEHDAVLHAHPFAVRHGGVMLVFPLRPGGLRETNARHHDGRADY